MSSQIIQVKRNFPPGKLISLERSENVNGGHSAVTGTFELHTVRSQRKVTILTCVFGLASVCLF